MPRHYKKKGKAKAKPKKGGKIKRGRKKKTGRRRKGGSIWGTISKGMKAASGVATLMGQPEIAAPLAGASMIGDQFIGGSIYSMQMHHGRAY